MRRPENWESNRALNLRSPSIWLVGIQFAALIFIAATGPILANRIPCMILEVLGLSVGIWAVLSMRLRHVRVSPEIAPHASLVTTGPYRFIRHPMYLAVLVVALALLLDQFSWPRGFAWLVLLGDILTKLSYEERLLGQRFPGYVEYRKKTKKLLPLVY
jgi:protein-S-isoprenylcysteine O-methyltransferase Ste14